LQAQTLAPGSPLRKHLEEYIADLKAVKTTIATIQAGIGDTLTLSGKRAEGGPVQAGGTYLVGEEGPELVTMGGSGYVTPNDKIMGALRPVGTSGGNTVNINVYPRTMPTQAELAEWIRSARRRGEVI